MTVAAAVRKYRLQLLGKRPGFPVLRSLNERGDIVGSSSAPQRPTCWDRQGKVRWRGHEVVGNCKCVNRSGVAVGNRFIGQLSRAVLFDDTGQMTDLSVAVEFTPRSSEGNSINDRSDIAGVIATQGHRRSLGFVALNGPSTAAIILGENFLPASINNARFVVGTVSGGSQSRGTNGFIWAPEMDRPKAIKAATDSAFIAVNDNCSIAGWREMQTKSIGEERASQACIFDSEGTPIYCWEHGPESVSMFLAINSAGHAVGTIKTGRASSAAFFDGRNVLDVNSLIEDRPEDLFLETASAISDDGIIVGTARRNSTFETFICLPS